MGEEMGERRKYRERNEQHEREKEKLGLVVLSLISLIGVW